MLTTKPPMASYTPKKVELKLALANEDGIDLKDLTKNLEGFRPTLDAFLGKLFVEKSERPAAEVLPQDEWVSGN